MKRNRKRMRQSLKTMLSVFLLAVIILLTVMAAPSVTTDAASAPKLTKTSLKILVGTQYDLNVSNRINKSSYNWATSNNKIAKVSQKGIVKGISEGKATIICKITTPNKKYKLTCKVTVSKPIVTPTPTTTPTPTIVPTPTIAPIIDDTPMIGKTAIEVVKEMGYGVNLFNTMEAIPWMSNPTVKDCETAWGAPVTTKKMIDGMKAAGFNSVRVPVAWSNLMVKDGKYIISKEYLNRIGEIVNYILDNDMYAVINDHWDGGWWEDFGSKDEAVRKETMVRYETMWKQIANYFADYSDHLIFESANEELGDSFKELNENDRYAKVNEINQKFVDVVRASGENNKTRYLLIAGYNTDIDKTSDSRFIMPIDVIKKHLIVSVHYYSPPTFCLVTDPKNSWGYMKSWGTDKDYKYMRLEFEKMQKFTKAGYGVIIGEYGVTQEKDSNGNYVNKPGTDKYFKEVVTLSKEMNYCPMAWAVYDRNICAIGDPVIAAIYK